MLYVYYIGSFSNVVYLKDFIFVGNYSSNNSWISCEYVRRSIDEFPPDFFSKEQRRNGAVIFHLLVAFYGFIFITFTCHDYFLPSVFCICSGIWCSNTKYVLPLKKKYIFYSNEFV